MHISIPPVKLQKKSRDLLWLLAELRCLEPHPLVDRLEFRQVLYLSMHSCIKKLLLSLMFISSSRNKFELLYQNSITDVFIGFCPPHVGAHPGGHQHGVSIQISWVKHFFGYLVYGIFFWPEFWRGSLYIYLLSFPRFRTLSIERFWFYFDLFWMAWHWKSAIKAT